MMPSPGASLKNAGTRARWTGSPDPHKMLAMPAIPATEERIRTASLAVLATVAGGFALYWLKPALIPFLLALLLAYAVEPVIDWLIHRARVPRWGAIVLAFLLGILIFVVVGGMITGSVVKLTDRADQYERLFLDLKANVVAYLASFGLDIAGDAMKDQLSGLDIQGTLKGIGDGVVDALSNTFLVLIYLVYLLTGHDEGEREVYLAADGEKRDVEVGKRGVWGKIDSQIRGYLKIKVVLSGITGVLTWALLAILGVELSMVFGVLAFLLNFIPSVGSIIATVLPIPIVLLDPNAGWATLVLAVVLPGSVQMGVGNVVEPKMLGDSLDLHPITVLLTLVIWGMLWGPVGMILATPLTAAMKILMEEIPLTRPIARLMAGRFQVGPMTTGDPVEPRRPESYVETDP